MKTGLPAAVNPKTFRNGEEKGGLNRFKTERVSGWVISAFSNTSRLLCLYWQTVESAVKRRNFGSKLYVAADVEKASAQSLPKLGILP
jgi:hypothetical protein